MTDHWHPAITQALQERPALAWAYDNDAAMHEQVRQLNVLLLALARAMSGWLLTGHEHDLADALLADPNVLPTDEVLTERRYEYSERLRRATAEMTTRVSPELMAHIKLPRCPACGADGDDACSHDGPPVMSNATDAEVHAGTDSDRPVEPAFGAKRVTCSSHRGIHAQTTSCIFPVTP